MFKVGQKVVCVYATHSCCLVDRKIYTCLGIKAGCLEVDCCSLASHHNHCGWFGSRFRPLIERSTDISFAHEILRKAMKRKKVGA